jgi:diketogulonate reductase-like aldo/keto reductase
MPVLTPGVYRKKILKEKLMKREQFLISVFSGVAFLLFFGCSTSDKAIVSPASTDGFAASDNAGYTFDLERGKVTLNNGIEMPILGIGTFTLTPEQTEESVYNALTTGFRLIDTANVYMNERAVGRGIKRAGVPREEIFVTTKLWPSDYEDVDRAINDTLARLNLEYIDLLLLHQAFGNYVEAYQAMETAVREGKVRSIGLSNFYEEKFDDIMRVATIPPAVLQIELNPYNHQSEMREYVKPYGTALNAWFPLGGRSPLQQSLFDNETIVEIAKAHEKTAAQVILRWHLQIGNIAIPGSSNAAHIRENFDIFGFALTAEEMQRLRALDTGAGLMDFRAMDEEGPLFSSFTAPMDFNNQE